MIVPDDARWRQINSVLFQDLLVHIMEKFSVCFHLFFLIVKRPTVYFYDALKAEIRAEDTSLISRSEKQALQLNQTLSEKHIYFCASQIHNATQSRILTVYYKVQDRFSMVLWLLCA